YQKGGFYSGKRFDGYFRHGVPYLDGYRAIVISAENRVPMVIANQLDAHLLALGPQEQKAIRDAVGDRVAIETGPFPGTTTATLNLTRKPFDDLRVRRALTLAFDRWGSAEALSKISNLSFVGGPLRPGHEFALTPAELEMLPGFGRNIASARA